MPAPAPVPALATPLIWFPSRGVAYQRAQAAAVATVQSAANGGFPEPSSYLDPLVDITAVTRDIPNFTALGYDFISAAPR